MTSIVTIILGMALLAISLVARYNDDVVIATAASWTGALAVIVGIGRMLFLERWSS